uniref:Predicted gene, ENSMUSG00000043225 n=1 Tax=Mus musculus TaxID=10090 RepID=Q922V8_MOUSE|nr:Predicted gene, ENSMUSG00000043225 [Mus musculus]
MNEEKLRLPSWGRSHRKKENKSDSRLGIRPVSSLRRKSFPANQVAASGVKNQVRLDSPQQHGREKKGREDWPI